MIIREVFFSDTTNERLYSVVLNENELISFSKEFSKKTYEGLDDNSADYLREYRDREAALLWRNRVANNIVLDRDVEKAIKRATKKRDKAHDRDIKESKMHAKKLENELKRTTGR